MVVFRGGAVPIEFFRKLGIDTTNLRRVIVDIPIEGVVTIYTEQYADSDKFEIDWAVLGSAQIRTVAAASVKRN